MFGYLRLAKVVLCALIGCSTIFGAILYSAEINLQNLLLSSGVMILAMGGATINSLQEKDIDAQMERTKWRPLPQNSVSLFQATTQSVVLVISGLTVIAWTVESTFALVLSAAALLIYNCIYTPLKKVSVLAIIPGAVCGALPPCIGWVGAGGTVYAVTPLVIFALFILWQVPHFWLVMLTYKQDYLRSQSPNMLKLLREGSIQRFFVTWIGGLTAVMIMFPILPLGLKTSFNVLVVLNSLVLLATFYHNLSLAHRRNYKRLFLLLNISLFLHMVIVSLGRLAG